MARFSIAGRSTIVPSASSATACLPGFSLFAVASRTAKIREVGVFNTTATACIVTLVRLTAAGTPGAALVEVPFDEASPAPNCTGFAGHTAAATMASGAQIRQASLPAAVGGGVIWTFGDTGIIIAAGTANGIGIITPSGFTGQVIDYYLDWDE